MKKTITKRDVLELFNGLNKTDGLQGVKFAYAVAKNLRNLTSEVESLNDAKKPSDKIVEFENKRLELVNKYAKKDENGKNIEEKEGQTLIDNPTDFQIDFEALKEEYKAHLDEYDEMIKEYNKILEEEIEVELSMIKTSDIDENITTEKMFPLYHIIEEDNG